MDYCDFRFGNFSSKSLNLVAVASSDRYSKNLLSSQQDYTSAIVGGDGSYYFGATFENKKFSIDVAFDSVTEENWRKISQLFATDKLLDLVFDELPFKTYRAKIEGKPEFKYICFTDRDTGQRVYKGEGTLNFICYFPYAYGFNKYIVKAADYYLTEPPENIIKKYYNIDNNMDTAWKGGYPTFEQVQKGELYFNTQSGIKTILDVRRYWENVPEWAYSSQLLTTPTLDFDQELMYLPQYSKIDYINMDRGLDRSCSLMGSRLLVYNPGDVPIDFKLKINANERTFWAGRGNHFQIRRLNVQRLTLPQAVDWTGLLPFNREDEKEFKYGKKYFKHISQNENGVVFEDLDTPPEHAYIVEPIPREKLGHYIRLFYWQSSKILNENGEPMLDYKDGKRIADKYEELYDLCIDESEQFGLYWKFLKEKILDTYQLTNVFNNGSDFYDENYSFNDFVYDFIHNPTEFIVSKTTDYADETFNISEYPTFLTQDYLEITTDYMDKSVLYVDSEKQLLYSKNDNNDFYDYSETKNIYSENIVKGSWFKIPRGWSIIEISPVSDDIATAGKTWGDARPFDWGYEPNGNLIPDIQKKFNLIYDVAAKEYLQLYNRYVEGNEEINDHNINFRTWYQDKIDLATENNQDFIKQLYQYRTIQAEFGFLKLIQTKWIQNSTDINNIDSIDEWWWYACNYIWGNFPPVYWLYADILNKIQIKYIPLFY